jgi:hypothetical protein
MKSLEQLQAGDPIEVLWVPSSFLKPGLAGQVCWVAATFHRWERDGQCAAIDGTSPDGEKLRSVGRTSLRPAPVLELVVIASTVRAGELSLRCADGGGGGDVMRRLLSEGFEPGDRVELRRRAVR